MRSFLCVALVVVTIFGESQGSRKLLQVLASDRRCDAWSEWGECDSPCGESGYQTRSRTCNVYVDELITESVTDTEFQQCMVECTTTTTTTITTTPKPTTTTTTTPKPTTTTTTPKATTTTTTTTPKPTTTTTTPKPTTTTTTTPKPTTTTTTTPKPTTTTTTTTPKPTTTKKPCTHKPKTTKKPCTKKPCTHKPWPTTTPMPATTSKPGGTCEQRCHKKKKHSCFKDVSNCHKYTICERVDVSTVKYYWKQYGGHCGTKYWSQSRQKCTTKKPTGCSTGAAETWTGSGLSGGWPSKYTKLISKFVRQSSIFHR